MLFPAAIGQIGLIQYRAHCLLTRPVILQHKNLLTTHAEQTPAKPLNTDQPDTAQTTGPIKRPGGYRKHEEKCSIEAYKALFPLVVILKSHNCCYGYACSLHYSGGFPPSTTETFGNAEDSVLV